MDSFRFYFTLQSAKSNAEFKLASKISKVHNKHLELLPLALVSAFALETLAFELNRDNYRSNTEDVTTLFCGAFCSGSNIHLAGGVFLNADSPLTPSLMQISNEKDNHDIETCTKTILLIRYRRNKKGWWVHVK